MAFIKALFTKTIFFLLPVSLKRNFVLRVFDLSQLYRNNLIVKIAETEEEILQALRIHQDSYQAIDLCEKELNAIRLTKYQALNSSTIIIAKDKNEVVGTITIVGRGSFGLPVEQGWNIDELTNHYDNIVEFSAFAVKRGYQHESGSVIFPLMKYAWLYSRDYIMADVIVGVVYKKYSAFYKYVLNHIEMSNRKEQDYNLIKPKHKISAFYLDLSVADKVFERAYRFYQKEKSLFHYFCIYREPDNFIFPIRRYYKGADYHITPLVLKQAIDSKVCPIKSAFDCFVVMSNLHYEHFKTDILTNLKGVPLYSRKRPRFIFKRIATFTCNESFYENKCIVENISLEGILITSTIKSEIGETFRISLVLNENKRIILRCEIVNIREADKPLSYKYGLKIISTSNQVLWDDFILFQNDKNNERLEMVAS